MPNPVEGRYIVQLGPSVTPDTSGEIDAWASTQRRSSSTVTRLAIERGLETLREEWAAEFGPLGAGLLARCTARAVARGEAQAERKARYAAQRRGTATPVEAEGEAAEAAA